MIEFITLIGLPLAVKPVLMCSATGGAHQALPSVPVALRWTEPGDPDHRQPDRDQA